MSGKIRTIRKIYCCGCKKKIRAHLVKGSKAYPTEPKCADHNFWCCRDCCLYVGTHNKASKNPLRPLGCIATKQIKELRVAIHKRLDYIWKNNFLERSLVYDIISHRLNMKRDYHTAEIRTMSDGWKVYRVVDELREYLLIDERKLLANYDDFFAFEKTVETVVNR